MAKSKEKKKKPKPQENLKSVAAIRKLIEERKTQLAKAKEKGMKDGKLNRGDAAYRGALKRVKRAQRKLASEAVRTRPRGKPAAPAPAAAPAAAAPAAATTAESPAAAVAAPAAAAPTESPAAAAPAETPAAAPAAPPA